MKQKSQMQVNLDTKSNGNMTWQNDFNAALTDAYIRNLLKV